MILTSLEMKPKTSFQEIEIATFHAKSWLDLIKKNQENISETNTMIKELLSQRKGSKINH